MKKRKKKTVRQKLKDQLEKVCKEYIKRRDKQICQKTGKYVEGVNCHVSHVIPKSHGNALRYCEWNLKVLSYHSHLNWWHKNPLEAAEWFKEKFPERWEYLQEHKNDIVKMTEDDLRKLIADYQDKLVGLDMSEDK